ncbi:MAG: tRNA (N6-isopentenyl adenosine(37)-C2)-methylthiotransferase MiaB [Myxococcota bacterium]
MTTTEPPAGVFVETYGCQMNELDSELVQGQLESAGWRMASSIDEASVVLINTCSVRDLAEHKVWSQLGRLGAMKRDGRPELVIGVIGCMAEREAKAIKRRMPHVDLICGPSLLDRLPAMLQSVVQDRHGSHLQVEISGHTSRRGHNAVLEAAADGTVEGCDRDNALDLSRSFSPARTGAQAYVRITRGCNKFCSFCVVPFTRGPEVHRAPQAVIDEVRKLVDAGVVEVTLLGQTVNHYLHKDGGTTTTFADLLWKLHEAVPALPRLRFVTSYPRDFDDATLQVMASAQRICRYLHLPVQSGSDRMLKRMNRGHTVAEYLALLDRARALMPDIKLASDMIVGFSTETEEDHQASMALLRRAQFKSCFVFKYSPRPGTVAHRKYADDVPDEDKRRRNSEMLDLQAEISLARNQAGVGGELEVLVESESKLRVHAKPDLIRIGGRDGDTSPPIFTRRRLVGRTRGNEIVAFDGPADLVGSIVHVRATDATPLTILADLWEGEAPWQSTTEALA